VYSMTENKDMKKKIKEEIKEKEEELKRLNDGEEDEGLYKEYDEWIDDINEPCKIGEAVFYASEVLKRLDPISYRGGFLEFLSEKADEIIDEIDQLKKELEEIENKEKIENKDKKV